MKRISALVLVFCAFSSCSLLKNRSVALHTKSTDTAIHVDSSTVSKGTVIDKSLIVTTEKAKGIIYTQPIGLDTKNDLAELLSGLVIVRDSGLVKITQSYDSITKQINTQVAIKPQPVSFDIDKTTTQKNDVATSFDSRVDLLKDINSSTDEKNKNTTSTPDTKMYIFLGILILCVVIYFVVKKKTGL